jgi:hypothetical protein
LRDVPPELTQTRQAKRVNQQRNLPDSFIVVARSTSLLVVAFGYLGQIRVLGVQTILLGVCGVLALITGVRIASRMGSGLVVAMMTLFAASIGRARVS